jgi:hypothetical protein
MVRALSFVARASFSPPAVTTNIIMIHSNVKQIINVAAEKYPAPLRPIIVT